MARRARWGGRAKPDDENGSIRKIPKGDDRRSKLSLVALLEPHPMLTVLYSVLSLSGLVLAVPETEAVGSYLDQPAFSISDRHSCNGPYDLLARATGASKR